MIYPVDSAIQLLNNWGQMFKKSFELGYDHDDVDENGKYTLSFYMTFLYFFLYLEYDLV